LEYKIFYKSSVEKDLKRIDFKQRKNIMDCIKNDIAKGIKGKKLKGEYEGNSYRTGNYRIVYTHTTGDINITYFT